MIFLSWSIMTIPGNPSSKSLMSLNWDFYDFRMGYDFFIIVHHVHPL